MQRTRPVSTRSIFALPIRLITFRSTIGAAPGKNRARTNISGWCVCVCVCVCTHPWPISLKEPIVSNSYSKLHSSVETRARHGFPFYTSIPSTFHENEWEDVNDVGETKLSSFGRCFPRRMENRFLSFPFNTAGHYPRGLWKILVAPPSYCLQYTI